VATPTPTPMAMADAQVMRLSSMANIPFAPKRGFLIDPTAARYGANLCIGFFLVMNNHSGDECDGND
jgi:hypothetical protein